MRTLGKKFVALSATVGIVLSGGLISSAHAATVPMVQTFSVASGPVGDKWDDLGGAKSKLGNPTSNGVALASNGQVQTFQGGAIYYSVTDGAHVIYAGPIYDQYLELGAEKSAWGFPTNDGYPVLTGGGSNQSFQQGIAWYLTETGVRFVPKGTFLTTYRNLSYEKGVLGYPIGGLNKPANGGQNQHFQNGIIFYSAATGTHTVLRGTIFTAYQAQSYDRGALGYPTSDLYDAGNKGNTQHFKGGIIFAPEKGTAYAVLSGSIMDAYKAQTYERGVLGYPISNVYAAGSNGTTQHFNGGIIFAPAKGTAFAVPNGVIMNAYKAQSYERGELGYPTSAARTYADGSMAQSFQGGSIFYTPSNGTRIVKSGPIYNEYVKTGAEKGPWGYPSNDGYPTLTGGGSNQSFQQGITWYLQSAGVFFVPKGTFLTTYRNLSYEKGVLGYPISGLNKPANGGQNQHFQGGIIFYSAATGTHVVLRGTIFTAYQAQSYDRGALGYPTSDLYDAGNKGNTQHFKGGIIFAPEKGTAYAVLSGSIMNAYKAQSYERGELGYPITDAIAAGSGGKTQHFDGGIIFAPSSGTAYPVLRGPIFTAYQKQSYERGSLGYPTGSVQSYADGSKKQTFQGGYIRWTAATGAVVTLNQPAPPATPPASRILSFTQVGQLKNYWCGPATGYMIAQAAGKTKSAVNGQALSQAALASNTYMQTEAQEMTGYYSGLFTAGLNKWMGLSGSNAYKQATAPSVTTLQNAAKSRIGQKGTALAADTVEFAGGAHYNGHPNRTIGHWIAAYGYTNNGATLYWADPATPYYPNAKRTFTATSSSFVKYLQSNGIVY